MERLKHIVMFSGGASSSVMAEMVVKEHGRENTVLLFTPTYAEHKDADRFRHQVANRLEMPITVVADGRDLWTLIEENNCLPGFHIPFCTTELKIKQSRKYWKMINDDFIVYFGYGMEEWRRVQKQLARLEIEGVKSKYPVFDKKITNDEVKRIIREEWKICLPEPYKYLEHNNCIPCFKGGKGHFEKVARYYPNEFKRAMALEEKIGYTVFKDITLKEIWERVQSSKELLFDDDYVIPCMCAD